ncbi:hypothetical protein JV173_03360 [Acholeplasma equirhinis]|uniref:hypothetical protein n=1 Tax=Acholeplasma equirhinis TaxID=555393 RepID=UPI00197A995B|nr:hypothetical protein [Acholeplasma equirhinis]MBN3490547.1 hypothetical protein [Acholeplasma equirhinis]
MSKETNFKVIKVKRSSQKKNEYLSGFMYGKPKFVKDKKDALKFYEKTIFDPRYDSAPTKVHIAKNFGEKVGIKSAIKELRQYKSYKVSHEG